MTWKYGTLSLRGFNLEVKTATSAYASATSRSHTADDDSQIPLGNRLDENATAGNSNYSAVFNFIYILQPDVQSIKRFEFLSLI